ncbi:MAG: alpha/beta hydrolase-fold protein [Planctomycetota bacterium]|nr:alpha/beta hydrolase-fold protein [Planctomycetota bacterium]
MNKRYHRIVCLVLIGSCLSLTQTAGAYEDPLRIAMCARFVASLCFTQNASALSNSFESEQAITARGTYEKVITEAREHLDNDRRGATDEYRSVLHTAKSDAMQAEHLDEAVKLDRAIKVLDGGDREYRMETLRRRVENTTLTDQYGQWDFFPEGRYQFTFKGKTPAPKPLGRWEVIDVKTLMAGTHPKLWIITFADDMRTAKMNGRSKGVEYHYEMRWRGVAGGGSKSKPSNDFKSREVRKARKSYDNELVQAQKRYRKEASKGRSAYRKALKSALKSAMKAEKLDEAVKLDKEIKFLDESSNRRKALALAIGDTTWRGEDGDWRVDFYADGTYLYNQKWRDKWEAVDENTIVAGSHPYLWALTFDDVRKRTHLRGTNGERRIDLWMVRDEANGQPPAPGGKVARASNDGPDALARRFDARVFEAKDGESLPYRLLRPKHYDPSKKYPLVLFLHGGNLRGSDNWKPVRLFGRHFENDWVEDKYPAFVLVPQCPKGDRWAYDGWTMETKNDPHVLADQQTDTTTRLFELLDTIVSELPVDPDRVYITGISMGGFGTWDMIMIEPHLFAAAAPLGSSGDPTKAKLIAHMPIWMVHGANDRYVPVVQAREMHEALRKAKGSVVYKEFPDRGHNVWEATYDDHEFFRWLFAQRRCP